MTEPEYTAADFLREVKEVGFMKFRENMVEELKSIDLKLWEYELEEESE